MSIVSADPATLVLQRNYDEMREATLAARRSLDSFFHAFHHRQPNQKNFFVQVFFTHRKKVEHVWMDELDLSSATFTGTPMDGPELPNKAAAQRRSFARDRITDWMYVEDGEPVGAYTVKVLRKQQRTQRLSGLRRVFSSSADKTAPLNRAPRSAA